MGGLRIHVARWRKFKERGGLSGTQHQGGGRSAVSGKDRRKKTQALSNGGREKVRYNPTPFQPWWEGVIRPRGDRGPPSTGEGKGQGGRVKIRGEQTNGLRITLKHRTLFQKIRLQKTFFLNRALAQRMRGRKILMDCSQGLSRWGSATDR